MDTSQNPPLLKAYNSTTSTWQEYNGIESLRTTTSDLNTRTSALETDILSKIDSSYDSSDFGWSLTSRGFVLNCKNDEIMRVDPNVAKFSGEINAASGHIANLVIDSNSIRTPTQIEDPVNGVNFGTLRNLSLPGGGTKTIGSVFMCSGTDSIINIGGATGINGWAFGAGGSFGVTNKGALYANNVNIQGTINSSSGTVGGMILDTQSETSGNTTKTYNIFKSVDESFSVVTDGNSSTLSIGTLQGQDLSALTISSTISSTSSQLIGRTQFTDQKLKVKPSNTASYQDILNWDYAPGSSLYYIEGSGSGDYLIISLDNPLIQDRRFDVKVHYSGIGKYWREGYIQLHSGDQNKRIYYSDIHNMDGTSFPSPFVGFDDMEFMESGYSWMYFNQQASDSRVILSYRSFCPGDGFNNAGYISTKDLGLSTSRWRDLYIGNSPIVSSDRTLKKDIVPLSQSYSEVFDSLTPVSFKYKQNTSNRTHTGFIAQDLKQAILDAGLTTQDFAAYCEDSDEEGNSICSIRYEELISLCVQQIQFLKEKVKKLEIKIDQIYQEED